MNKYMKILSCVFLIIFSQAIYAEKYLVKVGVLAYRGVEKAQKRWTPTIQHLQDNIPEYTFVLIPLGLQEMYAAASNNELDFVFTNSGHYYTMRQFGLKPIVSLVNLRLGQPYDKFGAVIFTRSDRSDINELEDVKGKTFAAVDQMAFGGFQMAWLEMLENKIDLFKDLSEVRFIGFPQDAVVKLVHSGKIDIGTVRTDTLERMHNEGEINLDDFKIINNKIIKGFPFKVSTRLYPEWPFCATKTTSATLSEKVKNKLLAITGNSSPAKKGKYAGWKDQNDFEHLFVTGLEQLGQIVVSKDASSNTKYKSVDELMKQLKIGPYAIKQ